jgi:hypothetical protein
MIPNLPVSDMVVTVKAREIQRALVAEMQRDTATAARHLLAAGHLELVLAEDYQAAGEDEMALRSKISAASCFWRAGLTPEASRLFGEVRRDHPEQSDTVAHLLGELARDYPPP